MGKSQHRSFRLSQPEYMRGRRVKPRLRLLTYFASLLAVGVALLSGFGVLLLLALPVAAQVRSSVFGFFLVLVVSATMARLTYFVVKKAYIRFGLMTSREADCLPIRERWPDCWLESAEAEDAHNDRLV